MPEVNKMSQSIIEISDSSDDMFAKVNFETYKQLKAVAREEDPSISKQEIYEKLLKPFRHEKLLKFDPEAGRKRIFYYCRYEGCDKEFTKTWNLLDHVRMHEGIRPYKCNLCTKTFTQKGNLKKHSKQHVLASLKDRKKFQCEVCLKKYTERYNLTVSPFLMYLNYIFGNYQHRLVIHLKIINLYINVGLLETKPSL